MQLQGKVALIFGAGGALGSAVSRAFAREGARVFLSGRRLAPVAELARSLADATGAAGPAEAAAVDARDEAAVERYVEDVATRAGRVDVALNAMGFPVVQGVPLTEVGRDDFLLPTTGWVASQFLTSRACARRMVAQRSGVILTLSASPALLAVPGTAGFGVACAAVEALTRTLAAELGPSGVRAVCLRPHRIGDTLGAETDLPLSPAEFRAYLESLTLTGRLPSLADVAETAVFLASDRARAITGATANLTCGMAPL
jgi:NAD(P)-dependent dehydrogenase (short-subunit alcohol dehydrogenase family)